MTQSRSASWVARPMAVLLTVGLVVGSASFASAEETDESPATSGPSVCLRLESFEGSGAYERLTSMCEGWAERHPAHARDSLKDRNSDIAARIEHLETLCSTEDLSERIQERCATRLEHLRDKAQSNIDRDEQQKADREERAERKADKQAEREKRKADKQAEREQRKADKQAEHENQPDDDPEEEPEGDHQEEPEDEHEESPQD